MLRLYPVVGLKYIIHEWDGSSNKVKVQKVSEKEASVTFQYDDGMTHEVSVDYFAFGLGATGIR